MNIQLNMPDEIQIAEIAILSRFVKPINAHSSTPISNNLAQATELNRELVRLRRERRQYHKQKQLHRQICELLSLDFCIKINAIQSNNPILNALCNPTRVRTKIYDFEFGYSRYPMVKALSVLEYPWFRVKTSDGSFEEQFGEDSSGTMGLRWTDCGESEAWSRQIKTCIRELTNQIHFEWVSKTKALTHRTHHQFIPISLEQNHPWSALREFYKIGNVFKFLVWNKDVPEQWCSFYNWDYPKALVVGWTISSLYFHKFIQRVFNHQTSLIEMPDWKPTGLDVMARYPLINDPIVAFYHSTPSEAQAQEIFGKSVAELGQPVLWYWLEQWQNTDEPNDWLVVGLGDTNLQQLVDSGLPIRSIYDPVN